MSLADSWDTWKDRGNAALKRGDLAEATEFYRKGIKEDPKSHVLHNNLSIVLFKQKKYDEALDAAHSAVELSNRTWPKAWFRLGQTLQALKSYPHAAAAYNRALALDQSNAEIFRALQELRVEQAFLPITSRGLKVSVQYKNPVERRGLFVKGKSIQAREVVFKEFPLLLTPLPGADLNGCLKACDYCGKILMTDTDILRSFLPNDKAASILSSLETYWKHIAFPWPARKDPPIFRCESRSDCTTMWCSAKCREQGHAADHQILCKADLSLFEEYLAANISDPVHRAHCTLILRIFCRITSLVRDNGGDKSRAWDTFSWLMGDPSGSPERSKHADALCWIIKDVITSTGVDIGLSVEAVQTKFSQLALNLQSVCPNPYPIPPDYDESKKDTPPIGVVVAFPPSVFAEAPKLHELSKATYKWTRSEAVDESGHADVTTILLYSDEYRPTFVGLWKLQSTINHSCLPTATVVAGDSAVISLEARCDLDFGEEVTTCYTPLDAPYHKLCPRGSITLQRIELLAWFGFQCWCDRCIDDFERCTCLDCETHRKNIGSEGIAELRAKNVRGWKDPKE